MVTANLVRLPDQFRPARDRPMAATPTCCCCCCCCVATLVTSSIVLPMRVEMLARRAGTAGVDLRPSKWIAGLAAWTAFGAAVGVGILTENAIVSLALFPLVIVGMLSWAYTPSGDAARSVATALVIVAAFVGEFVLGLAGILGTAGIAYVLVALIASGAVVQTHRRSLIALRASAVPSAVRWSADGGEPPAPPPLPRPPSNDR